ncbi:MAG: hypothetical protein DHS20C08_13100 [Rhodomicrobium sp.]|nr:MAG: hypothetical protein DHS20C08_13100 [Rhodomicrobium sp.]
MKHNNKQPWPQRPKLTMNKKAEGKPLAGEGQLEKWGRIVAAKSNQAPHLDGRKRQKQPGKYGLKTVLPYCRMKDLPSLIPLWPKQIEDFSEAGTQVIMNKLQSALLAERRRARTGHWAYNLNRHRALLTALEGERAQQGSDRNPR